MIQQGAVLLEDALAMFHASEYWGSCPGSWTTLHRWAHATIAVKWGLDMSRCNGACMSSIFSEAKTVIQL